MSDVIKTCGCGQTFTDCPCGSTIAVLVSDLQEDERLAFELKRLERARSSAANPRARSTARSAPATRRSIVELQRVLRFNADDLVLVATMNETLQAAE